MSTFREDIHLGHKVPLIESDDIRDGAITTDKLADGSVTTEKIKDGTIDWVDLNDDLQNIIETTGAGGGAGIGLSKKWGTSDRLGITQNALSAEHRAVSDRIGAVEANLKDNYYSKDNTYSRGEVNDLIVPHDQDYVDVASYASLPEEGEPNTLYRVKGWNGTESATNCFSVYAYSGDSWTLLAVMNPGVDSSPTANSHNLVESGGVKTQLGYISEDVTHNKYFDVQQIPYINTSRTIQRVSVQSTTEGVFSLNGTASGNGGYKTAISGSFSLAEGAYRLETDFTETYETEDEDGDTVEKPAVDIYLYHAADESVVGDEELFRGPYHNGDTPKIYAEHAGKSFVVTLRVHAGVEYDNLTGKHIRLFKSVLTQISVTADDYVARTGVEDVNNKINGINAISVFRGKKISIIGDSISTFDDDDYKVEDYAMYYPNGDVEKVNQTYWKQLIDICGGTLEANVSYSGSCATNWRSSGGYPSFYDRCTAALLGDPDVIIVELGQNDSKLNNRNSTTYPAGLYDFTTATSSLSEGTFATAYIKGIKKLKDLYPNAEIYCISTKVNDRIKTAISSIAKYYGCCYVDVSGYDEIYYPGETIGSGHPTAEGMKYVANKIINKSIETQEAEDVTDVLVMNDGAIESATLDFEQGSINSTTGADSSRADRIRSGYLDADAFVYATVNPAYVLMIMEYNEDKTILGSTSFNTSFKKSDLRSGVSYIRFVIAVRNSVNGTGKVDDQYASPAIITPSSVTGFTVKVNKAIYGVLTRKTRELVKNYDGVGNAEFWLNGISSAYSDMTWVGDRLIGFTASSDDLETDSGTITINVYSSGMKNTRASVYTLKHYWGHCNTVDYNPYNDCLILGNGSGKYNLAGKIFIIPDFSTIVDVDDDDDTPLTLSDVSAVVIDCEDMGLGTKFNLVWGDDNDKKYNIAYLITAPLSSNANANVGDFETIRKIALGATYSGSTVTFTGTFEVVDTYHQTTAGYADCDQGTCYHNGALYAAIGHNGLHYWKMRMAAKSGEIYRESYKQYTPNNSKNASGICVKDGYLFIGRSSLGIMALPL